ncbi:uncharacterized protein LOC115996255 isoform X2 [Ipomoea triloba]|uniref:uncharacterized protein LOC115996255 isoform X2 n=1 Tax=Ipomoea triloba TaxID=35885 RepID=UPI00125D8089|nr:uncharacterized protein LOC115996255 isoform X2 [Ipomoea triloba]
MTQTLNSSNNRDKLNGLKQSIKFLYSYGGRIVPRRPDGKLRYIGGLTRVLSVHRSINFAELMVKFGESCGESMSLRCKLPTEDLDVLVSVRSDEDLANVIEEYDRVSAATNQEMKIRAVLSPINPLKKVFAGHYWWDVIGTVNKWEHSCRTQFWEQLVGHVHLMPLLPNKSINFLIGF